MISSVAHYGIQAASEKKNYRMNRRRKKFVFTENGNEDMEMQFKVKLEQIISTSTNSKVKLSFF